MTTAHKAEHDTSMRGFALDVVKFTRCTKYVFADKSFLIVHWNGRTEVNAFNP